MNNPNTIKTNYTLRSIKNNTCAALFAVGLCFALIHVCLPKQPMEHLSSSSNAHPFDICKVNFHIKRQAVFNNIIVVRHS